MQGNQPTRRRPQSMGLPMPIHAATGSRGGRPAAALIRSRRNVPHSISPLFGTLRPSPRRAVRSGAVTPRRMRFREQPRRLERLARALAVSLIVVWVAAAVGCRASDEAAPNTSSPHVAQPSEDVTPAPTREVARSSASAVEAQATPAATPAPPPAATPAPNALATARGNASANALATARGNASATARGNASATARGNASATARGNANALGNALAESPTAAPDPAPSPTSTAAPVKTEPPVPLKEAPPADRGREFPGPRTRRCRGFRLAAEGEPPTRPQDRGDREEPGIGWRAGVHLAGR